MPNCFFSYVMAKHIKALDHYISSVVYPTSVYLFYC